MLDCGHGGDVYGNQGVQIDFSVNTNPLGMPDRVREALITRVGEYSRYPDPLCRELRAAISVAEDVPEDWILCGNGASDLIYRFCYAVKPRCALVCQPTFSQYAHALTQSGCRVESHALREENGFALTRDIEKRLEQGVDALFLCHPNNPTGRVIEPDLLERILALADKNGTRVVMDECFLDFTDGVSSKKYLRDIPGLAVLKAFTKIYALAGLRLGYLLTSDRSLLGEVSSASQCWGVSVPAQIAGVVALSCTDWTAKTRKTVSVERQFLSESFRLEGIKVFSGDANFLLLRSCRPLYEPLLKKGILIRSCANFEGLGAEYFRVAVKTHSENVRLIAAVKEVLNG